MRKNEEKNNENSLQASSKKNIDNDNLENFGIFGLKF